MNAARGHEPWSQSSDGRVRLHRIDEAPQVSAGREQRQRPQQHSHHNRIFDEEFERSEQRYAAAGGCPPEDDERYARSRHPDGQRHHHSDQELDYDERRRSQYEDEPLDRHFSAREQRYGKRHPHEERKHRSLSTPRPAEASAGPAKPKKAHHLRLGKASSSLTSIPNAIKLSMLNSGLLPVGTALPLSYYVTSDPVVAKRDRVALSQ